MSVAPVPAPETPGTRDAPEGHAAPEAAEAAAKAAQRARRVKWGSRLGAWTLWLLGRTWRLEVRHDDAWRALRARGEPLIIASWHGTMLSLVWSFRGEGLMPLASEHGDGVIMGNVAQRFGFSPPAAGSTTRGGHRGLMQIVRALREGTSVAFTPDGPRGPARESQPGALVAAWKSGRVILPVGVHADRAWRLKSWDRFTIPKPFARVRVAFGEVLTPRIVDGRLAEGETERLTAALLEAEARARA